MGPRPARDPGATLTDRWPDPHYARRHGQALAADAEPITSFATDPTCPSPSSRPRPATSTRGKECSRRRSTPRRWAYRMHSPPTARAFFNGMCRWHGGGSGAFSLTRGAVVALPRGIRACSRNGREAHGAGAPRSREAAPVLPGNRCQPGASGDSDRQSSPSSHHLYRRREDADCIPALLAPNGGAVEPPWHASQAKNSVSC